MEVGVRAEVRMSRKASSRRWPLSCDLKDDQEEIIWSNILRSIGHGETFYIVINYFIGLTLKSLIFVSLWLLEMPGVSWMWYSHHRATLLHFSFLVQFYCQGHCEYLLRYRGIFHITTFLQICQLSIKIKVDVLLIYDFVISTMS